MYAIGGSANPTINSEGNQFNAPNGDNMKEVKSSETGSKRCQSYRNIYAILYIIVSCQT
jgi:hypothetical protein